MKTLFGTNKYVVFVLGIASCAVVLSCAEKGQMWASKSHKTEIMQGMIVLHPMVKLSELDEQTLNNILKNYDKRLYKVEMLDKGKVVKTRGLLPDAFVSDALKAEVDKAKSQGESDWTWQTNCGATCITDGVGVTALKKKKLMEQLTPVLEKYQ